MRRVLFLAILCVFALSLHLAADWPNFLGPNKDNISPEKGINKNWSAKKPAILWKVEMGDSGFAGPSVAAGKVFILDRSGNNEVVRAIDLKTGKDVWRFSYPDQGREDYGHGRSTPTYDKGRLYTISRKGMVHCLNAETGKKIWGYDMIKRFDGQLPRWQLAISPFIDGKHLILCPGGEKNVVKVDKLTGKTIWRGGNSDVPGYATPVLATFGNKRQYLIFTGKKLIGVDTANGKVLWQYPWDTAYDVNAATPLVIGKDRVFITTDYSTGCAMLKIGFWGAGKIWKNNNMLAHFTTPIYYDGYIYGNSNPDYLMCLDPKTGAIKWKMRGFDKGGLILVEDVIIALGGRTGVLKMIQATPHFTKTLGSFKPLGGQSWTAPVLANGKLIIRNKYHLACIDLQ